MLDFLLYSCLNSTFVVYNSSCSKFYKTNCIYWLLEHLIQTIKKVGLPFSSRASLEVFHGNFELISMSGHKMSPKLEQGLG